MAAQPDQDAALTQTWFAQRLAEFKDISAEPAIAVALSGGGDSMALTWLLSRWAAKRGIQIHALTVNHGLRTEAAAEAREVGRWVQDWGLTHKILVWKGPKPVSRIQEEARKARYDLLATYCLKHKIRYLFLAHHANDQAETILFRLAKGSGLDGLSGMACEQPYDENLILIRPLLDVSHAQLLKTCKKAETPWVEDKSNVSDRYARIRLRQSMDVLETEGLTLKRITTLGGRMERARKALDQLTDLAWKNTVTEINTKHVVLIKNELFQYPEEIIVRLMQRVLQTVRGPKPYPPRLENLEDLVARMLDPRLAFRGATLGGCMIRMHQKKGLVTVEREASK